MPDRPSIPQFCCATCANWRHEKAFGAVGKCARNFVDPICAEPVSAQTLDLDVCSLWEKSDQAEKGMYGKQG